MFIIAGKDTNEGNEGSKFKSDAHELEKIFNHPPFYCAEVIDAATTCSKGLQSKAFAAQLEGIEKVIIYYTGHTPDQPAPGVRARSGYTPIKLEGNNTVKMSELLQYGLSLGFKMVVVGGVCNLDPTEGDPPPQEIIGDGGFSRGAGQIFSNLWSGQGGMLFFSCSPRQKSPSTKEYVLFTRTLIKNILSDQNNSTWSSLFTQTAHSFLPSTVTHFADLDNSSPVLKLL